MSRLPLLACLATATAFAADPPLPPVPDKQPQPPFPPQENVTPFMLVPGFIVRELPVKLTSLNNIEYAPDGRLFAGGYDGRFHLLRDTDGDGLEDKVDTFQPERSPNYPLGMVVDKGDPCAVLTDEIVRFRDTNGDGIPDTRETIAKGFDDPELVAAKYLNHRRVDSSMALAHGPDGAWYVTMGNAGYNNPYWHEGFKKDAENAYPDGPAHYSPAKRRGCLLRITPDGKVEQLNSGLRYIMALQFNKHGDLFGTDQEGATWCPNGNPYDELLHIQPGRHYGFPPSHPTFLKDVVDEPSVWDFAPQHESACGMRFNTPGEGRGRFGPAFWEDNAITVGESRGVLWRTDLAKTAAGYVARTELIARIGLLAVDCAISPAGDLLVCCHTGKPDWGNGPQGEGRLFKFSYTGKDKPQPALAWAASATETVVAFDKPLPSDALTKPASRAGRYVAAGDQLEAFRPPYKVVSMQQHQPVSDVPVKAVRPSLEPRNLSIETAPRDLALNYSLSWPEAKGGERLELAHDLTGVDVEMHGTQTWKAWLPHPDFTAARQFTRGSMVHDHFWKELAKPGKLVMRTRLDLWNLLQPRTQPGSKLDYQPAPEVVTLRFKADSALQLEARDATVEKVSDTEAAVTVNGVRENLWPLLTITLTTPATRLDVSYTTKRDQIVRAPGVKRFLVPFAKPAGPDIPESGIIPQLAGGDWAKGHELFKGKAACATCHTLRGEGVVFGPDLNNLVHRDYDSVMRDIVEPNAVINPDAVGYSMTLADSKVVTGTLVGGTAEVQQVGQPGGQVIEVKRSEIKKTEIMPISLMPMGLDKALTKDELRDLMTYLLTEPTK